MKKKTILSWSSGKDSAWCLHVLKQSHEYEVVALLTTMNSVFDRVAMHSTRRRLLELQAESAGLPLWTVPLPWPCSNEQYESAMAEACERAVKEGVQVVAFGDLFLEDVRKYREDRLRSTGLEPIFPLWQRPTRQLLVEMIDAGVRTRIVSLNPKQLDRSFAGRDIDLQFLNDLPVSVDPCGENGEFHTFTYAGPMFGKPIPIASGEIVERDGFVFADVNVKFKAAVSWSGGKDGCLALHRVKDQFEVCALVTMLTEDGTRTRSHGLRPAIIERHASSLGAEAIFGCASWPGYEEEFIRILRAANEKGVTHAIFGDVFPAPHREWVERVCREAGVEAVLPLWANSTRELAHEFIAAGGVAQIVTTRESVLDASWLGRTLTVEAFSELETMGVDPCGENGEFHTLVTAMPGLIAPMTTRELGRLSHGGCWLLDLALVSATE